METGALDRPALQIRFSNSHVSSSSLRKSRASFLLSFDLLPHKRERSAVRRGGRDRADQARRPTSTTSEGGLAVRRSTAASSRLSPRPWGPAALWPRLGLSAPGGDTERARGVCLTPGGLVQGRPGSRLRSRDRRRRSPFTLGTPAEHPSGGRGCFLLIAIVKPCQADFLSKIDAASRCHRPPHLGFTRDAQV